MVALLRSNENCGADRKASQRSNRGDAVKVRGIPLPFSQSCRDVNPQLGDKTQLQGRSRTRVGLRCGMNKTESEFALILEAQKRNGEISRYVFEGVTLRFANVKFTPDFIVFGYSPFEHELKFIEVKGPFIKGNRERAVERFRHAKTYWPEFTFEMWQRTKDGWKQLI